MEQKEHGLQEPSPTIHWLGHSELTTYQCISVSLSVEWGNTGPTAQQGGTRGHVKRLVGASSQAGAGGRREEALGTATASERMVGGAQEHVMPFDICSVQLSHLDPLTLLFPLLEKCLGPKEKELVPMHQPLSEPVCPESAGQLSSPHWVLPQPQLHLLPHPWSPTCCTRYLLPVGAALTPLTGWPDRREGEPGVTEAVEASAPSQAHRLPPGGRLLLLRLLLGISTPRARLSNPWPGNDTCAHPWGGGAPDLRAGEAGPWGTEAGPSHPGLRVRENVGDHGAQPP